jgi:hypothetical protein
MDVRLSSVRFGRRLLGAAGRDLLDASIIDSSSIRITSERDRGFESCFLQRGVYSEPDFRARDVARPAHRGGQLDRHHLAGDEPIEQVADRGETVPAAPTGMGIRESVE